MSCFVMMLFMALRAWRDGGQKCASHNHRTSNNGPIRACAAHPWQLLLNAHNFTAFWDDADLSLELARYTFVE